MISYFNSMMIQFKMGEIISSVKDLVFAIVVVSVIINVVFTGEMY